MGKYSETHIQDALKRMTNWQISQWQRAGRPTDKDSLERFATMKHWKAT